MRSLGMTPVLPGFAGHVPDALLKIYPDVSYQVQSWLDLGFSCNNTCTILLDPRDPVFKEVGIRIMEALILEFGTDHLYSSDPFRRWILKQMILTIFLRWEDQYIQPNEP